jgi:DNA-directed RNA polymerase specialized sigma24 family protein
MDKHNSEESRALSGIALRRALKQLPKAQYDAYLYVEILGFTTREAGRILSRDFGTVAENLRAARVSLKRILQAPPTK